jgi:hypothetical protein
VPAQEVRLCRGGRAPCTPVLALTPRPCLTSEIRHGDLIGDFDARYRATAGLHKRCPAAIYHQPPPAGRAANNRLDVRLPEGQRRLANTACVPQQSWRRDPGTPLQPSWQISARLGRSVLRPSRTLEQADAILNSRHDADEVPSPPPIGMSMRHTGRSLSRSAFAVRKSGAAKPSAKRS